ncbi:MAG TPA: hypothetical protein PLL23_12095, partial [Chitinophagaceae bacterium]|nr:hypothetical protein [Chitinophagaceae bacterium]
LEVGGSRLEVGGSRLEVGEVEAVEEVEKVERLTSLHVDRVEEGVEMVEEVEKVQEVEKVERLTSLHIDRVEEGVEMDEEVDKEIVTDEVKIETGDNMNSFETAVVEEVRADVPVIPVPVSVPVEAVNPANDLVFEPYHTVDYFASQGIRIKEEERPTDQFGKQLKSFTDWLKTLKRLPTTELTKDITPQSENKVEQLAGQSITDREVLTEAMAEVWEKQGNTLKATEIYRKLSLLEPTKSAYFAAKIEGLKKKN